MVWQADSIEDLEKYGGGADGGMTPRLLLAIVVVRRGEAAKGPHWASLSWTGLGRPVSSA